MIPLALPGHDLPDGHGEFPHEGLTPGRMETADPGLSWGWLPAQGVQQGLKARELLRGQKPEEGFAQEQRLRHPQQPCRGGVGVVDQAERIRHQVPVRRECKQGVILLAFGFHGLLRRLALGQFLPQFGLDDPLFFQALP